MSIMIGGWKRFGEAEKCTWYKDPAYKLRPCVGNFDQSTCTNYWQAGSNWNAFSGKRIKQAIGEERLLSILIAHKKKVKMVSMRKGLV